MRVDPSVTVIPEEAFQRRQDLEEVELPEGLIRIEEKAFHSCRSLKRANIPSTVLDIGERAFDCCRKLELAVLPEGLQQLGQEAFHLCISLKRINIPPNLDIIGKGAFCNCWGLTETSFSEGLQEIERDAFSRCKSLVSVTLPSSLESIGVEAFEGCDRLKEMHMHDAIESIEARSFKYCNFTNFRIPPLINKLIDVSILGDNTCLVSLELPETIKKLDDKHQEYGYPSEIYTSISVCNVALPPEIVVNTVALKNCADLGAALSSADVIASLQHRFDDLPIHRLCYYQSYNNMAFDQLNNSIEIKFSQRRSKINLTGKQQDCLGMTPLHILACSTKPTIEMYRLLIEKYPETLIVKDKWGDIPLLYAIWCNAPTEVVDLLVESYKSLHPDYEFDWSGMLLTLVKRTVPLSSIQKLINTQQQITSDYDYGMQDIVLELLSLDVNRASLYKPPRTIEILRYLLQISIRKRIDLLAVERWRVDLGNIVSALPLEDGSALPRKAKNREKSIQALYTKLATYESIKEGTSILELALWKAKIYTDRNKKARIDSGMSYKDQCRINCGADIIIRNVLPYLLPNKLEFEEQEEER